MIGSGTQADPYTQITGVGFEWLDARPSDIYVAIGCVIDIHDDEYELSATDPSHSNFGLDYNSSLGYWSLHGTVTATSGQTMDIWLLYIEVEEEWQSTTMHFVSLAPTVKVKVSGSWKSGTPYVKVNGTWKQATKVYVKVNGTWKESN